MDISILRKRHKRKPSACSCRQKDTKNLTKIWLEPEIEIAKEGDLNYFQRKEVLRIANENKDELLKQWKRFKKGQEVKIIKKQK